MLDWMPITLNSRSQGFSEIRVALCNSSIALTCTFSRRLLFASPFTSVHLLKGVNLIVSVVFIRGEKHDNIWMLFKVCLLLTIRKMT